MSNFLVRATSASIYGVTLSPVKAQADPSRAKHFLAHWKQKLKETPGCPYATRMIKRYSEQLKKAETK